MLLRWFLNLIRRARPRPSRTYTLTKRNKEEYQKIFDYFDSLFSSPTRNHFLELVWEAGDLRLEGIGLAAYLNMYEGTGNEGYLNKFKDRCSKIFEHMPRGNTDQCLGWNAEHKQHWNLVNNPYLDTDPLWPKGWKTSGNLSLRGIAEGDLKIQELEGLNTTRPNETTGDVSLLNKPLAVISLYQEENDPMSTVEIPLHNPFVQDNPNYEPGKKYAIACWAKMSPEVSGTLEIIDPGNKPEDERTLYQMDLASDDPNKWEHFKTTDWLAPISKPREDRPDLILRISRKGPHSEGSLEIFRIVIQQFGAEMYYDSALVFPLAKLVHMYHKKKLPRTLNDDGFVDLTLSRIHAVMRRWEPYLVELDGRMATYLIPDNGTSRFPGCSQPFNYYMKFAAVHAYLSEIEGHQFSIARKLFRGFQKNLRDFPPQESPGAIRWKYWAHWEDQVLQPSCDSPVEGKQIIRDKARPESIDPTDFVHLTHDGKIQKQTHWSKTAYAGREALTALISYQTNIGIFRARDMRKFAKTFLQRAVCESENGPPELNELLFDKTCDTSTDKTSRIDFWIDWLQFHDFEKKIFHLARERFDHNIQSAFDLEGKPIYKDVVTGNIYATNAVSMLMASEFVRLGK